ncbi:acyltransferase family protein [Escherichia coli]|uniref:acyltransferase family protein n=1 Tax=Escherichia coli TaxID=562 RepID=UPI000BA2D8BC|nr:acyltransferase [Escherichia coli]PAC04130.1 hypothetical protein CDH57_04160 [Escherichia coli]QMD93684.1 acyltransferase [Escherichia coli]
MVLSIHYLRGLAALFVVCFHFRGYINNTYIQNNLGDLLFSKGSIGVDIFFIISGFIISLATEKDNGVKSFALKRIFRIYPVYLFFIITMIIMIPSMPAIDIIKSMLFVNLNYSLEAPYFGYSVIFVGWSLTYEVLFYFYFLISIVIGRKYRVIVCSFLILSSFAACNYYIYGTIVFDIKKPMMDMDAAGLLKLLSSPMFIEFIIGMVFYEIHKKIKSINQSQTVISLSIIAIILSFASLYNIQRLDHGPTSMGAIAAVIIFTLIVINNAIKYNKLFIYLGDISYSLYLSHAVIITFIKINHSEISAIFHTTGISFFMIVVLLSIIMATITHKIIEVPSVRWCRKFIN